MNLFTRSAWPMLLLTMLIIAFFVGGVFLEFEAVDHGIRKLSEKFASNPALLKDAVAFQTDRIARIYQAAAIALDLSKIGLGALVVLATQQITVKN